MQTASAHLESARRRAAEGLRAGAYHEARGALQSIVQAGQADATVWYQLGYCLQALGQYNDASKAYQQAVHLSPQQASAWNNLAVCREALGQFDEAVDAFGKAAAAQPNLSQPRYNAGRILYSQRRFKRAAEELEFAAALEPGNVKYWQTLRSALNAARDLRGVTRAYQRIAAHSPDALETFSAGLAAARRSSTIDESQLLSQVRDWLHRDPQKHVATDTPLISVLPELICASPYFDLTLAEQRELYDRLNAAVHADRTIQRVQLLKRTAGSRIRLGYLSADFRGHVMGKMLLPVIQAHHRDEFDVFLFSSAPRAVEDVYTESFLGACDKFVRISDMDDAQAARVIAEHDLDVLVDLASHTEGGRPFVLARKPARVVITHLGYHGCVGLDAVDYKMTDAYCETRESVRYQIETPLPLDTSVLPMRRTHEVAESSIVAKQRLGLAGKLVFCAFINVVKLSPRLVATWKSLLDRLPDAVIAFSPFLEVDREAMHERLGLGGIADHQISFIPANNSEAEQHLRYAAVDVALDTFPYSGGDTTIAALEHSVPVVTLEGDRHASRVTSSILRHLGVTDLIASDEASYVEAAIRVAQDERFRGAVRDRIRKALADSPHADPARYAASLERAYRKALSDKGIDVAARSVMTAAEFQAEFQTALRDHESGALSEAQRRYVSLLADQPDFAALTYLYGMLRKAQGDTEEARTYLARTIASDPNHVDALIALANIDFDAGRHTEAESMFARAASLDATRADALNGQGLSLVRMSRREEAVATFERAIAASPKDALSYYNLATTLQELGRTNEARANFRQAVALKPDYKEAIYNYGVLLRELGQDELAIKCLQRVIQLDPQFEEAYWQLRPTLLAAGKIHDWLQNLDAYEKQFPNSPRHALYLVESDFYLGKPADARKHLDQAIAGALTLSDEEHAIELLEELLYVVLFFDIAPADHLRLYQRYDMLTRARYPRLPTPRARDRSRRIKLGYLSGDVRNHVMGKMLHEIVRRHDRSRFEVTVYSLGLREDEFTRTVADSVEHFQRLAGSSVGDAAARIRADDIDILIDCSTHTRGSEPGIVVMRPARCQMTHVASSGALGSSSVDFKLTDRESELPENQQYLIETLLPIDGCVYPYHHVEPAVVPHYRRSVLGLPDNAILFGAFVQILKLSPRLLAVWKRVLTRLPQSKIVFSPGHFSQRQGYINLCKAAGIAESQVTFLDPGRNEAENIARYGLIDLVMDTFPYGGVNGTLEALDAGVPVVTLAGRRNQERTSTSILTNLGVPDLIAHSEAQYVELACKLALDHVFGNEMQMKIRAGLKKSTLTDMDAHVRSLEQAYLKALAAVEARDGLA